MKQEHVELICKIAEDELSVSTCGRTFIDVDGNPVSVALHPHSFEKLIAAIEAEKAEFHKSEWAHNGARLRLLCQMVGINTELLGSNEELDGVRFSMLGEIRRNLSVLLEQRELAIARVSELERENERLRNITLDAYDAGQLNNYGGGDVSWWHDYIRSELDRAHDFYITQLEGQTK